MNASNIELLLNILALFFCSVAVYAWDEVYGITKKGRISGGWIYLMAATVMAVVGIYPAIGSFFYQINADFQRYWVLSSKVMEGIFLMVAGVVFYNNIYRSLRTGRATPEKKLPKGKKEIKPAGEGEGEGEVESKGVPTDLLLRGVLGRLSLYWGPDVSRQLLVQTLQGRVPERKMLQIVSEYLPMTDEEKWKQKWTV